MLNNLKVKAQNGHIEYYNKKQITNALLSDDYFLVNILKRENGLSEDIAKNIANKVTRKLAKLEFDNEQIISSDTIRGIVASELIKLELFNLLDITEIVGLRVHDIYDINIGAADNDNANLTPNPETSHKLVADAVMKKYYLRMIDKKLANAHISGDISIHDFEYFGTRPFCKSWDLRKFFKDGFAPDGENNGIVAFAPKHAEVAILQATKVLAMGQCNHAGGQGLLYGTVFLAPYMQGKTYKEIKQLMQMMMYELNQMYISRGGQTIFSSINVSPGCPKVLEDVPIVYQGKIYNGENGNDLITYKDLEKEIRLQFKALMELSMEGDCSGKLFPFPKIEIAIEKKFIDENTWNNNDGLNIYELDSINNFNIPTYKELYKMAFDVTAKYGILYFDNLMPESKKAETSCSCTQCCAYSFATDENSDNNFNKRLNFEDGYFFNNLGGMQAVSINLPRCAYKIDLNKNIIKNGSILNDTLKHDLMINIYDAMDIAIEVFKIKKEHINNNIHRLKYLTQKGKDGISLTDFDQLVYEIGIVGLNEMCQYATGYQLHENQEAIDLGKYILSEMNNYCKMMSELHGIKIVLARTPAETVAQKFAVCDLLDEKYKRRALTTIKGDLKSTEYLKTSTKNLPIYYSNGFAPYVGAEISIFEKLRIEDQFWPFIDGGAITHIWLGEKDPDPEGLMTFALNICKNTNVGYFAFTKDLSQCIKCNSIEGGLIKKCNKCGSQDINWMSRVTGYYSEVAQIRDGKELSPRWNAAKREELNNRNKNGID